MRYFNKSDIEKVLSGKSSKNTAQDLVEWFADSSEGQQFLSDQIDKDIYMIEEDSDFTSDLSDSESRTIFNKINKTISRKIFLRKTLITAAIFVPILIITLFMFQLAQIYNLFGTVEMAEVYVPKGEMKEMVFQDGSYVTLNSDTKIIYPKKFGLRKREVFIEGEAYFQITSNKKHPFIVTTKDALIKVTGTSFNVNAYETNAEVRVVLDEGSLSCSVVEQNQILNPGQKLVYNKKEKKITIETIKNSENESLWKHNCLVLKNTSLSEVLGMLSRRFDVDFEVVDNQALKYTFNLITTNLLLDEILEELELIAPIKFDATNDTIQVDCL